MTANSFFTSKTNSLLKGVMRVWAQAYKSEAQKQLQFLKYKLEQVICCQIKCIRQ